MFIRGIAYSPDAGDGEGGTTTTSDPTAAFQRLLDRHNNDALALANKLYGENFQSRERIRHLEADLNDARKAVPSEGSVVLSKSDAEKWAAYQTAGDVATIQASLTERDELRAKLTGMERDTLLRQIAERASFKPSVLSNLDRMSTAAGKQLTYELREVEVNGQKEMQPYVVDGETAKLLAEFAAEEWADFMPALSTANSSSLTPAPTGTRFIAQGAGTQTPKPNDLVDSFVSKQQDRAKAVKNPLLP